MRFVEHASVVQFAERRQLMETAGAPGVEPTAAPSCKVTVKDARFVTTWRWNVTGDPADVCGICRNAFDACCPTCKVPGDDCPPMVGGCMHAFHLHCITTWLGTKDKEQVCPLCRRPWD
jgi:anaphase-promoting complex subunit 11